MWCDFRSETSALHPSSRRPPQVVRATIQEAFPDHAVLGEESVGSGSSASAAALESFLSQEWLWIVDPIDGTTNFVHGIPASVVSIGVAHQGTMVAGVVLDPFREELFSATAGGGAHCNGEPITVSAAEKGLAQAVLAFGTGHEAEMAQTMCAGAGAVSPHCRSVRSFGSAALHLSWVACGRLTVRGEAPRAASARHAVHPFLLLRRVSGSWTCPRGMSARGGCWWWRPAGKSQTLVGSRTRCAPETWWPPLEWGTSTAGCWSLLSRQAHTSCHLQRATCCFHPKPRSDHDRSEAAHRASRQKPSAMHSITEDSDAVLSMQGGCAPLKSLGV